MLATLGAVTIRPTFAALGAHGDVLEHIHDYLVVYYPGTVLFTVTMVAGNVMRATGDARVPALVMTVGALFNLLLDPILIFGWLGVPRFGLTGAAFAMVLSRLVMTTVLLYIAIARRHLLLPTAAWPERIWQSWREILAVGIPAMATQMIGPITGAIITRLLATHGKVVVAGFGVAGRIEAVAVMLLFALSGSIGPFVGQNWGAHAYQRVDAGIRAAYQFSLVWGAIAWLVLWALADRLIPLVDDNPAVVASATAYLAIVPVSYGLWGVLMMASASFNSLGKPIPSTLMAVSRMFIIYVPLAMLGNHYLGYQGIFIATATANAIMGAVGYLWLKNWLLRPKLDAAI
jgi:MATE family, multidrug efflux pump